MLLRTIKEIKVKAKSTLISNFRIFVLPTFAYMCSIALQFIFAEAFGLGEWQEILSVNETEDFLWLVPALFVSTFVFMPVTLTVMYKVGILLLDGNTENINESIKKFLTLSNIKQIILINFIPGLVHLIYMLIKVEGFVIWYLPFLIPQEAFLVAKLILSSIAVYVNYKFFICNYYFAKNEAPAKETILCSFETMKRFKIFIKEELLQLSFILWQLLATGIYWLLKAISESIKTAINDNASKIIFSYKTPLLDVFLCFYCGLGFFIYPYMFLSFSLLCEKLMQKEERNTGDGSVC